MRYHCKIWGFNPTRINIDGRMYSPGNHDSFCNVYFCFKEVNTDEKAIEESRKEWVNFLPGYKKVIWIYNPNRDLILKKDNL